MCIDGFNEVFVAERPPFRKELLIQFTGCVICTSLFVILVVSFFGFEGDASILIICFKRLAD